MVEAATEFGIMRPFQGCSDPSVGARFSIGVILTMSGPVCRLLLDCTPGSNRVPRHSVQSRLPRRPVVQSSRKPGNGCNRPEHRSTALMQGQNGKLWTKATFSEHSGCDFGCCWPIWTFPAIFCPACPATSSPPEGRHTRRAWWKSSGQRFKGRSYSDILGSLRYLVHKGSALHYITITPQIKSAGPQPLFFWSFLSPGILFSVQVFSSPLFHSANFMLPLLAQVTCN